jgi:serine protease inhibitor ecotin
MKKVYSITALWLLSAVVSVHAGDIRYNTRLPVVVYAPEGVEVRYRIWSAE